MTKVVQLAVVRDPVTAVAERHRLRPPGRRVDDAQAPVAQCTWGTARAARKAVNALAVGAPVRHRPGHRPDDLLLGAPHASADPAHAQTPGRRTTTRGGLTLSLIHISEPTRRTPISYAVFCLK